MNDSMKFSGNEKAIELIKECKKKKTNFLDLGSLSLLKLPEELFELVHLEKLNLTSVYFNTQNGKHLSSNNKGAPNQLNELPKSLLKLSNLKEIYLYNYSKEGFPILQKLKGIKCLQLWNCQIEDASFLEKLTNLTYLDLSSNDIQDYSFLEKLTNLTSVKLRNNKIEDASFLEKLTNLTSINLNSNKIEDASFLEKLTNLTSVKLRNNKIQDYSVFEKLTNLTSIDLCSNEIQDASFLEKLINLTSVELSFNKIEDASFLGKLTNLTSIDIDYNEIQDVSFLEKLTNLTSVKLRNNKIEDASFLEKLKNLTSVDLDYNKIEDASFLGKLKNLTSINLSSNEVQDYSFLEKLTNLTSVNLSSNKIEDASFLEKLTNLTSIDLGYNKIEDASFLEKLTNLTSIDLGYNKIEDASFLEKLRDLCFLNLNSNKIEDTSFLEKLRDLYFVNLSYNQIQEVTFLRNLTFLEYLQINNNRINEYPKELLDLPRIKYLTIRNNPIRDLPYELVNSSQCLKNAKQWFIDLENGKEKNFEVKLIIIGNGRVGKTCIVNRLVWDEYNENEPSTHAIQIERWKNKIEHIAKENVSIENVVLNIWDFGGQDIYHSTHQLFLQSRALYLLAWDAITERKDFSPSEGDNNGQFQNFPLSYWLDYIRILSKNSPVVIVQNKVDRDRMISIQNMDQLDVIYKNILDHVKVSAKTAKGFKNLEEIILDGFKTMPELGMEMPLQWYNVRKKIIGLAKNHKDIPFKKFIEFCDIEKVREVSQPSLLRYLHDTGVLFYKENLFNNKIILDQKWAIEAVYTLFDRDKIFYKYLKRGNGKFSLNELAQDIWTDYTIDECKIFLSFMESCEICFKIRDDKDDPIYIAPQLVSSKKTYLISERFEEKKEDSLHVIFKYAFLQKAIVNRFIVRAKELIEENELWENGLVFKYKNTEVLIESRILNKETIDLKGKTDCPGIYIQVFGNQKKNILFKVIEEFENIHHSSLNPEQYYSANGYDFVLKTEAEKYWNKGVYEMIAQNGNKVYLRGFHEFLQKNDKEKSLIPGERKGISDLKKIVNLPDENSKGRAKIFISYSHKDESYKDNLLEQLYSLKRKNKITIWEDRQILAGGDWKKGIHENLESADIIILMISSSFIKSEFCYSIEMQKAIERSESGEAITIPVIIRACDWQGLPFGKFQSIPRDNKPISTMEDKDSAYLEVVKEIKKVVEKLNLENS